MTAERLPSTTELAAGPPADPRPAWERVAYIWLEREVDGGHQVDPAALATEVSVSSRLATDLVRVLRAQRQRDPDLAELRGRLVRDQITDAYLAQELRGGTPLEAAELAGEVGTTVTIARQWLHTLRAARSGDPRLAGLRTEPVSHGQPTPEQLAVLQAAYANGGRPDLEPAARPAAGPLERIERAWRTREVGHGEHLDPVEVAREVGVGRAYAAQTLAALRGGELTNTQRITQLWQVIERDGGHHLDAPAVARMLGIPAGRIRQVLGPLRTQQRQAADQQTPREQRLPLVAGEGPLGWMDQAACKGLPTERFFPDPGEGRKTAEAKAICATCDVQEPCRDLAIKAADSLDSDHGVFGGTVPTERSHLRPNRFPEPGAYRQDHGLAERAHELASRVGLRQAAKQLGASRDTLKRAWEHWGMPQPEGKPGIPPSRFLADRDQAERAFQRAEELGSLNAAARELGTTWPSLRKAFQRHQLGMPTPNPQAVNQRKSAAQVARLGSRQPAAPELDPAFVQLNSGTVPRARGYTAPPAVRLRRAEEIETLGFGVVADMNRESRPTAPVSVTTPCSAAPKRPSGGSRSEPIAQSSGRPSVPIDRRRPAPSGRSGPAVPTIATATATNAEHPGSSQAPAFCAGAWLLSVQSLAVTLYRPWSTRRHLGVTISGMARVQVQYKARENAGHKFWVARYGHYAIRIDANRPGVYSWLITLEGRSVRKGVAPGRDQAADAVGQALDELLR